MVEKQVDLNFDVGKRTKSIATARKSISKIIKLQSLITKFRKTRKKQPCEVCKFCIYFLRTKIFTTFGLKAAQVSCVRDTKVVYT